MPAWDDSVRTKHPSYGVLVFCRGSVGGRGSALFGSTLRHHEIISMEVKTANLDRHINRDWIHGDKTILRIDMSPNQFVEAITHMNVGDGVPITIRCRETGGLIEEPPYINERQVIENEFKQEFDKLAEEPKKILAELRGILGTPGSIRKRDIEKSISLISRLAQDLQSNIPYMRKAAQEMIDKGIKEAKHEIESSISTAINRAGIEQIDGNVNKLIEYMGSDSDASE